MTEDEIVDSELLQDVFIEETEWDSHSPLQTEPCLPSTPVRLQCTGCLQKMNIVYKSDLNDLSLSSCLFAVIATVAGVYQHFRPIIH